MLRSYIVFKINKKHMRVHLLGVRTIRQFNIIIVVMRWEYYVGSFFGNFKRAEDMLQLVVILALDISDISETKMS